MQKKYRVTLPDRLCDMQTQLVTLQCNEAFGHKHTQLLPVPVCRTYSYRSDYWCLQISTNFYGYNTETSHCIISNRTTSSVHIASGFNWGESRFSKCRGLTKQKYTVPEMHCVRSQLSAISCVKFPSSAWNTVICSWVMHNSCWIKMCRGY